MLKSGVLGGRPKHQSPAQNLREKRMGGRICQGKLPQRSRFTSAVARLDLFLPGWPEETAIMRFRKGVDGGAKA
ncbi:hypothetical protein ACVDG5_005690 [Mesorhizobium sp. ORM6]